MGMLPARDLWRQSPQTMAKEGAQRGSEGQGPRCATASNDNERERGLSQIRVVGHCKNAVSTGTGDTYTARHTLTTRSNATWSDSPSVLGIWTFCEALLEEGLGVVVTWVVAAVASARVPASSSPPVHELTGPYAVRWNSPKGLVSCWSFLQQ